MLAPSPDAVPDMVRDAFRTALSDRPGPVYIEIPSDFWAKKIDYVKQQPNHYKNLNSPFCDPKSSQQIHKGVTSARQP